MLHHTISVYFNPREKVNVRDRLRADLQSTFFRHDLRFKTPRTLDELSQEIRNDVQAGVKTFACVGGDGSVSRLVREIHPGKQKIFVLPFGTANDLGNQLGLTQKIRHMKRIVQYETLKRVDVLDVNGIPFLTHGGIGTGARLCEFMNFKRSQSPRFTQLTKQLKSNSYGVTLLKQILTQPMPHYEVLLQSPDLPPEGLRVRSPMVMVSNQPLIAGKIAVAPDTEHADGKFCVSIFRTETNAEFLGVFARLRLGKRADPKKFQQFETSDLTFQLLEKSAPVPFFADGDVIQHGTSFAVKVRPEPQEFYFDDPSCDYTSSYSLAGVPEL